MYSIVSAFYVIESKFNLDKYKAWYDYFLDNINCELILFTNKKSSYLFDKYKNKPNIKIIIYELEEFYNYKYYDKWIENHKKNYLLNKISGWELNMLWSEKISFVKTAIEKNLVTNDWICWCDIGYFRKNLPNTISKELLQKWPNKDVKTLQNDKIYYSLAYDNYYVNNLYNQVNNVNINGLPKVDIPLNQLSIAGGFFLINKNKVNWWHNMYDKILNKYFNNNKIVKDDQIIIVNAIFLNIEHFTLLRENGKQDNWFLFQKWLL